MEAYCVKCKGKVEMKDPQMTQTKRGTNMMKGKCPTCGTTVCRIVGKKKPAGNAAPADTTSDDAVKTDDTAVTDDATADDSAPVDEQK